jgi:hypothetical protein
MKTITTLLILLSISYSLIAKERISSETIIQKINNNKDINYHNVIITGKLDFTKLDNMICKNSGASKHCKSTVKVSISFTDCEFEEDVKGTTYDKYSKTSYKANFEKQVIFKNCQKIAKKSEYPIFYLNHV